MTSFTGNSFTLKNENHTQKMSHLNSLQKSISNSTSFHFVCAYFCT